ncbi:hypothetical protein [Mycobacterium lepromatosis]|uniref:hypothetical protein n=1 Tax=Mycobacterium lepromatosis TaxID=480418 RepID=UPI0005F88EF3|nr:hypothetical protein [Mycobacterium lepromatosis]
MTVSLAIATAFITVWCCGICLGSHRLPLGMASHERSTVLSGMGLSTNRSWRAAASDMCAEVVNGPRTQRRGATLD